MSDFTFIMCGPHQQKKKIQAQTANSAELEEAERLCKIAREAMQAAVTIADAARAAEVIIIIKSNVYNILPQAAAHRILII